MLADPALQERFIKYLELHKDLGEKEMERCSKEQLECMPLAKMYYDLTLKNLSDFCDLYHNNVLEGFRDLEDSGHIDLITTAATHAYLPLYCDYPTAIRRKSKSPCNPNIVISRSLRKDSGFPSAGISHAGEYLRKQEIDCSRFPPIACSALPNLAGWGTMPPYVVTMASLRSLGITI
jgi:1,4-alpha-glucan branching enzyme